MKHPPHTHTHTMLSISVLQEEIQRLLQSREVNRAFEAALSTSDLSLVLYLCQQVTPEEVFDKTPCPLSQPVLLSLIQQFSVDLSEHVDLKLKSDPQITHTPRNVNVSIILL